MARAPQPAGFSTVPYDHIPLLPVNSSQLKAVGYDARRHILAAQFLHGAQAVYHYPNVTPELYAEFAASDSKGTFFGQHIKALPFEKYPASVLEVLPEVSIIDALVADLKEAAATLRRYESYHRAKGTPESDAKAKVNAELATRFEATVAKATGVA